MSHGVITKAKPVILNGELRIQGEVVEHSSDEFKPGDKITTSAVVFVRGNGVHTRNSSYRVIWA